ncbi:peptidoglycan-binding protein [Pelagibacterium halotolerans]|uniref:Lysozyme n=1 Tax=Pelagibacterium halotolerans (strain DSM 22347 / JCM 15775 / CGMCC 1.7692 / B2) TaxID=1082931 RepID=G4RDE4_PELHB|nr:peptidoglycan-binding protein [Pelagibacterium halotolerans]AEQ50770.1 phage-related lysozyme [Pelagibacterium halotolerans B2]QJR19312.1 lysozyme [Pelagibacterium halotolerans]SDZ95383.1 lysozyme [Pelagibacterium halotolerans]
MSDFVSNVSGAFFPVLRQEEGDVLRTYRCPAGFLTIGMGLTKASGVVDPKPGMTITAAQSLALAQQAIARNYAPRVRKWLPTRKQHVFDGATLFDYNTGRIHNASWVKLLIAGDLKAAQKSFKQWVRGGGKVLGGLVRRRDVEWQIIEFGIYPAAGARASALSSYVDHAADFKVLGYGLDKWRSEDAAIRAFQRDHDLTEDGIIGPATRAGLTRAMEARRSGQVSAGSGAAGGAVAGGGEVSGGADWLDAVSIDTATTMVVTGVAVAAIVFGLTLAWRYRGPLFAWLPEPVKDLTERFGLTLGRRVRT